MRIEKQRQERLAQRLVQRLVHDLGSYAVGVAGCRGEAASESSRFWCATPPGCPGIPALLGKRTARKNLWHACSARSVHRHEPCERHHPLPRAGEGRRRGGGVRVVARRRRACQPTLPPIPPSLISPPLSRRTHTARNGALPVVGACDQGSTSSAGPLRGAPPSALASPSQESAPIIAGSCTACLAQLQVYSPRLSREAVSEPLVLLAPHSSLLAPSSLSHTKDQPNGSHTRMEHPHLSLA